MEATWNPAKQCRDSGDAPIYQPFVKIWLGGPSLQGARSANPQSIFPGIPAAQWIPGLALRAIPE
jgi:hypothetical protein